MTDVTIPAEQARNYGKHLRIMHSSASRSDLMLDLADLLDPPPADISVTDAEHLRRAEVRLDTISPVIVIDPAMGVNITEQIKTLFQVVAKSPRHGAAIVACDCLVCASVHSIADTILRESAPPAPSLRDEVAGEIGQACGSVSMCWDPRPTGVFDSTPAADFIDEATDAVLAVVRRHVEALPATSLVDGVAGVSFRGIDRDDVLRLLGASDD